MPEARLLSRALLPDFHRLGQLDVPRNLPDAHGSLDFPIVISDLLLLPPEGRSFKGERHLLPGCTSVLGPYRQSPISLLPPRSWPQILLIRPPPALSPQPPLGSGAPGLLWGLLRGTPWRISGCRPTPSCRLLLQSCLKLPGACRVTHKFLRTVCEALLNLTGARFSGSFSCQTFPGTPPSPCHAEPSPPPHRARLHQAAGNAAPSPPSSFNTQLTRHLLLWASRRSFH